MGRDSGEPDVNGPATCTLFNLQRFSTEDGPGIRTTCFFKGCPLTCPWCHNPEGLRPQPEIVWQRPLCIRCGECTRVCRRQAIGLGSDGMCIDRRLCEACGACVETCPSDALERVGTVYDAPTLLAEVLKDRTFYSTSGGGITLSGGEPLMQHAFLREFAPLCRADGLHVALDTCGCGQPEWLDEGIPWVDLVLFDLKLIDPDEHQRSTGVPLDGILANLDRVVSAGLPIWVRTPIIPGFTDAEANLRGIAAYVRRHVSTLQRYDLLAFSNLCTSKYDMLERPFELSQHPLLSPEALDHLVEVVRSEGIDVARWSGPSRRGTQTEAS
jgi:pyruvate formate lyase activating enzyme